MRRTLCHRKGGQLATTTTPTASSLKLNVKEGEPAKDLPFSASVRTITGAAPTTSPPQSSLTIIFMTVLNVTGITNTPIVGWDFEESEEEREREEAILFCAWPLILGAMSDREVP